MKFEADPGSLVYWPQREDLSGEFVRLLAASQDGGSTVAECLLAASRIRIEDDDSWHREWSSLGDANRERGRVALGSGNHVTAQANWLRAINYYQASAFPFDPADKRQQAALSNMRECARSYLRYRTPAGERVQIAWRGDYPLEGYFLPAESGSGLAPAVICIGEPGRRKEEYLFKLERHARNRGMSLLAVDLCGEGAQDRLEEVIARPDLESAISHVMDYLAARDDVDERRIAILADECGSSFVARGVELDPRFAAAVCDGGIWDLQERAFLASRLGSVDADMISDMQVSRIARNIACPLLVTLGERGWLKADRVRQLYESLSAAHGDLTLKIFTAEETAAAQGHVDNPTLANEYIFDWIANQFEVAT